MLPDLFYNPSLTIALALAAGIIAQALAHHLRVPGIVVLLLTGVLLGPDAAGLIHPQSLGEALSILTGFAVAVILFEGGLNLKLKRLKREQRSIQQLVTLGALITFGGSTLAVRICMHWPWPVAILFGSLVIVTGPTVITPLLRRLKVKRSIATILEAEGVLIDAIGAVTAAVTLEIIIAPAGDSLPFALWHIVELIGFGILCGLVGGIILAALLRRRNLVPEGNENIFVLCLVLALYHAANVVMAESGIVAVTIAGIVVGNIPSHASREIAEFKEQLTVMLIGMLFVLLAADVRVADIVALGLPGVAVVGALIFIIRPLNVWVGTLGSHLDWRQKLFIGWIGPRGIVAAAVASLFATLMDARGIPGGNELRALVFMVITITVVTSGLTGGILAHLLKLRRPNHNGWVIAGANILSRALAAALSSGGEEVVCIDSDPDACKAATDDGRRVIFSNVLEERTLLRAEIDTRAGAIGMTPNEEVNYLFVQKAKKEGRLDHVYLAVRDTSERVTRDMIHQVGAEVLFAGGHNISLWIAQIERKKTLIQRWRFLGSESSNILEEQHSFSWIEIGLPIVLHRKQKVFPISDRVRFKTNDEVEFILTEEGHSTFSEVLKSSGWEYCGEACTLQGYCSG